SNSIQRRQAEGATETLRLRQIIEAHKNLYSIQPMFVDYKGLKAEFEASLDPSELEDFCCPITHELFDIPVSTILGSTYELSAIVSSLSRKPVDPCTGTELTDTKLSGVHSLVKVLNRKVETFAKLYYAKPHNDKKEYLQP
ncbi:MAG: U-box domain-containing protein, partial [Pseudomonadota bacterium]|nr:U-box domain-containing protein [Pseudomonadota bacterium]